MYYQEYPQTEFEWNSYIESPPEEMMIKIMLTNEAKEAIWYTLLILVFFEIFSYIEKPKEHWANLVIGFIKKLDNKDIEEDEVDKNE